ncbi:MAG: J domain-containing protein [Treponema sp.]|nr:J domain-containing protein [Treponema sp.]
MGIWGRLGNVVKSYLYDDSESVFKKSGSASRGGPEWNAGDSDMDAAYEELDAFLRGEKKDGKRTAQRRRQVPAEILEDFAELGLTPQASAGECKAAYKKLLKTHHPDRHAANPQALKKATEKTARVNAAYERLEKWLGAYA